MDPSIVSNQNEDIENDVDPITDIIDYLVRCANVTFKATHADEIEVHSCDNARTALQLYQRSPCEFLTQFGKYLKPSHLTYFDNSKMSSPSEQAKLQICVNNLKAYHSDVNTQKRIRNRRYNALQKLRTETDYFSEKEMMLRNPLLYEQLVGQFLTDEEIRERDGTDSENITLLNLVLDTIDRNKMREIKNKQMILESIEKQENHPKDSHEVRQNPSKSSHWGGFDVSDTNSDYKPEARKASLISAPERRLLREEFVQEMFFSFIEGRDSEFDYDTVDNDEQYDDLQLINQDAEDKYFDSETNEVENLEEHMELSLHYKRNSNTSSDDPLDVFMEHLNKKAVTYHCLLFLINF